MAHYPTAASQKEIKDGFLWLIFAGIFAIGFSYTLWSIDEMLTHSPRERVLSDTLKELRTAQSSFKSLSIDERYSHTELPKIAHEVRNDEAH
jgi:hypothetical protein